LIVAFNFVPQNHGRPGRTLHALFFFRGFELSGPQFCFCFFPGSRLTSYRPGSLGKVLLPFLVMNPTLLFLCLTPGQVFPTSFLIRLDDRDPTNPQIWFAGVFPSFSPFSCHVASYLSIFRPLGNFFSQPPPANFISPLYLLNQKAAFCTGHTRPPKSPHFLHALPTFLSHSPSLFFTAHFECFWRVVTFFCFSLAASTFLPR